MVGKVGNEKIFIPLDKPLTETTENAEKSILWETEELMEQIIGIIRRY